MSSGVTPSYTALYTAYVTSVRCCIPEYKVDLPKLIDLLVTDKKNNPSNYSLAILSEGAEMAGIHREGVWRCRRLRPS